MVPMDGVSSTFVALSVAALLLATTGASRCPIELSPSRAVVKYGEPVFINCTSQESQETFVKIGWEAKQGGRSVDHINQVTWAVESLTEWEEEPSCFFTPAEGTQCEVKLDFVLYTFPDSIEIISTTGSDGVVTLLENHNLTCRINNVAPVKRLIVRWFKNDILFKKETFKNTGKSPSNVSDTIQLTPLREDSEAVYRCEARLDLGPEVPAPSASTEYTIKVHYGPEVSCSDSLLMVKEGTALGDVCNVTGNPIKSVQWLKDGNEAKQSIPLTKDEYGNYTLKVDGSELFEQNFTIHVLYGPILSCNDSQTVMENEPFHLSCLVEGYPKPNLTFFKDDEDEQQLLNELTRRGGGLYKIHASNGQQTVKSQINITVIYPPSQISELEESVVNVGSDVSLKCSSKGNPQPEYLWQYYNSSNVAEKHEDGVTYLSITNATAMNMGLYTCSAKNSVGHVWKTVKLKVEGVCPIEVTPNRMVVEYQSGGQQVTCKSFTQDKDLDVHWIDNNVKNRGASWLVDTYNRFDLKPYCEARSKHDNLTCGKQLDLIVYKLPHSVSIDLSTNSSSVVEDTEFQLQCRITDVAPARSLTVRWYQDGRIFKPQSEGTVTVTDCLPKSLSCDIDQVPTPVTVLFTISLNASRAQSGELFQCEPQLDLGPEGPQSLSQFKSKLLNLTVYYKPIINVTKLPRTIPVFNGYPEDLVCEVDGNPPPDVAWFRRADRKLCESNYTLRVSEAGFYYCNATNAVGSVTHEVEVILKEDYLPLIAGFVAVVVIIISIIFAFIYSIYYKNTKMRRYSLKNVKLNNTHNGNVAHNGWERQIPMKRLS